MTAADRAALLADVADICIESMQHDATQLRDIEITVRYSDCVRRAIIRQSKLPPWTRRHTRGSRTYAQVMYVVKWLEDTE